MTIFLFPDGPQFAVVASAGALALPITSEVIIYSRPGCHLCDEAKQTIEAADCLSEYTLEEFNIESDADLLRRRQHDVPVITINGVEVSGRLTAEAFLERLRKCGGRAHLPDLRGFRLLDIYSLQSRTGTT